MEYKIDSSLERFQAWSGGKDTLDVLIKKGDCDDVEVFIEDVFCDSLPTDTDINDLLWFERDAIAEHLGYRDWDAYEDGWSESDLEDAEDWFNDADFDTLERISGLRRVDYSDEDGYQDFVDAAEEWWNSLEDKKKVDIYYANN